MHFHQKIHHLLLKYRNTIDSTFNFIVRQRASLKDKKFPGGKFAHGLVFQGNNDYCFVGLIDRSGGINATRSVGLVFKPIGNGFKVSFDIVFPGEKNKELVSFYKTLAKNFKDISWGRKGDRAYLSLIDFNLDNPDPLYDWLENFYPIIQETALNSGIMGLIPSDERFQSLQNNLQQKLKNSSKGLNYWIFQGNPSVYNIKNALKGGHVQSWKVAAHRDRIKIGDKVILWQTGEKAGCYALAEVTSEVSIFEEESYEKQHYLNSEENSATERVKIKIDKYLIENPILWKDIKNVEEFSVFKAGNQGTNFKATEGEYNAILNLITDKITSKNHMTPTNLILYGPPGTGKTFYLKNKLFNKYTSKQTSITKEQHLETVVSGCSWWQVIAIALLDLKKSKVSEIIEHQWVKKKASLSNSKTVRPTLWGQLQSHTINECENVNVSIRQPPLIFNKTEDSFWEILKEEVDELVPELYDLKDSVDNYNPNPDKIINHYDFVTFHQSFAYEDFIEGIKPILPEEGIENVDLGYTIENGVFKSLCIRAQKDPDNKYAIFIDEINRGNVSAIFGELITLIELDKRKGAKNELSIKLPYSKKEFCVPSNLDIYGTMNTADRSVEALDTALRRRFVFKEVMPKPDLLEKVTFDNFNLKEVLILINKRIEALLDRDHTIGHSYFMNLESGDSQGLLVVFENNIIPLLQEYFYNDYQKMALILGPGFVEEKEPAEALFPSFKSIDLPELTTSFQLVQPIEDIEKAILQLLVKAE